MMITPARINNYIRRLGKKLYFKLLDRLNAVPKEKIQDAKALLDRERVRTSGAQWERKLYHQISSHMKSHAIAERRRLGEAFLREFRGTEFDVGIKISAASGLAAADLSSNKIVRDVLTEGRKITASVTGESPSKGSLTFLGSSSRNIPENSPISEFARSPLLLLPIIEYLGMMPILFGFDINRAQSNELLDWSSQLFHFDPEDVSQIKVFLPLVDVDSETRPFTALPAEDSAKVAQAYNYTVGRLTDEKVERVVGQGKARSFTGPAGTVVFCDTNRCFHYGGRPGAKIRDMLTLYYSLPTSTWFPLHAHDGERRKLTSFLTARPNSPYDKALLGEELLY